MRIAAVSMIKVVVVVRSGLFFKGYLAAQFKMKDSVKVVETYVSY